MTGGGRHLDLRALPGDRERRAVARRSAGRRIHRRRRGVVPDMHVASVRAILVSGHHINLVIWRPMCLPYSVQARPGWITRTCDVCSPSRIQASVEVRVRLCITACPIIEAHTFMLYAKRLSRSSARN
jgi:hypothetical protein